MSEVSNWQKTKNLATGIWNSIGGSRYYKAGLMDIDQKEIRNNLVAKTARLVESGGLSAEEANSKLPTYKNSLMDSIRTNKNPFHSNTNIGILAGTSAAVGYSYANDDMDNYKRNVAVGGLSGGLGGHLDKVLSGAMQSQGKLTKELEDYHVSITNLDDLEW